MARRRTYNKSSGERCKKNVGNLTRLHRAMQQSDVVYWEPPQRVGMKRNQTWLANVVTASVAHRRNLKTILGVKDSDICQNKCVRIVQPRDCEENHTRRHCSVTGKVAWCDPGVFPVIPKTLKRKTIVDGSACAAAVGAGDADMDSAAPQSGSDSDVDADAHDFTADGALPETLTSLHTVNSIRTCSPVGRGLPSGVHHRWHG